MISEGGENSSGVIHYKSTEGTHVDANVADTIYAVVGLRLKSTHLGCTIHMVNSSLISETNDDFEWMIIHNPAVAGTFTYGDLANSCVQTALGVTDNVVTGGTIIGGGFAKSTNPTSGLLRNAIRLGAAIDGTLDTVVLCVRPLGTNADIQGSVMWRELG